MGFPGGTVVKNLPANAGDREMQLQSLGLEDPLEQQRKLGNYFEFFMVHVNMIYRGDYCAKKPKYRLSYKYLLTWM